MSAVTESLKASNEPDPVALHRELTIAITADRETLQTLTRARPRLQAKASSYQLARLIGGSWPAEAAAAAAELEKHKAMIAEVVARITTAEESLKTVEAVLAAADEQIASEARNRAREERDQARRAARQILTDMLSFIEQLQKSEANLTALKARAGLRIMPLNLVPAHTDAWIREARAILNAPAASGESR